MKFLIPSIFVSLAAAAATKKAAPCGAVPPPLAEQEKVNAVIAAAIKNSPPVNEDFTGPVYTITVYWHSLNGDSTVTFVDTAEVSAQLQLLNNRFQGYGFQFKLGHFDYHWNNSWADVAYGSDADYDMKNHLRRGYYYDLNIYAVDVPRSGQDAYQGFGAFPYSNVYPHNFVLDGVTLAKDVLVGGSADERHEGVTAVHEVGHWLNLYHPFATGNCDDHGDYVADTPPQSNPSYGCPTGKDSCPTHDGKDSIANYMDYSADYCRTHFTVDQVARARHAYQYIRLNNS